MRVPTASMPVETQVQSRGPTKRAVCTVSVTAPRTPPDALPSLGPAVGWPRSTWQSVKSRQCCSSNTTDHQVPALGLGRTNVYFCVRGVFPPLCNGLRRSFYASQRPFALEYLYPSRRYLPHTCRGLNLRDSIWGPHPSRKIFPITAHPRMKIHIWLFCGS